MTQQFDSILISAHICNFVNRKVSFLCIFSAPQANLGLSRLEKPKRQKKKGIKFMKNLNMEQLEQNLSHC